MSKNEDAHGIMGKRSGGEPDCESKHFFNCAQCGQAIDMRDLGQVLDHEDPHTEPITKAN